MSVEAMELSSQSECAERCFGLIESYGPAAGFGDFRGDSFIAQLPLPSN